MKTGIVLAFIIIVLATSGCHKKSPAPLAVDNYAASFFTGYQPGTYWIYQDSTGLITDSEAVTFQQCGPEVNMNSYEQCYLTIYSDSVNGNASWSVTRYDTVTSVGIEFDLNKPALNESYVIYFNNNSVDITDTTLNPGITVKKIDTIQVNQFAFYNALKISYSNPSPRYIVIVPNIGIVERLVPDSGYVLKLKRYHIVS